MGIFKKKPEPIGVKPRDESVIRVFKKGNLITRLSFLIFGLGNIVNRQIVRGLLLLAVEAAYFVYLFTFGIGAIGDFITLGTVEQG